MLVDLLQKNYSIATNQSIISRDLRELNVSKRKLKDTLIYELQDLDVQKEILRLGVLDIVHNEATIIVKTLPGLAAFVGDYLDLLEDDTVLATLAGENVVFVTPVSIKKIQQIFIRICELLHFKPIINEKKS